MIVMKTDATREQIDAVIREIERYGLRADVIVGAFRTVIGPIGDERLLPFTHIESLPGVKEATMVEAPYKLINREYAAYYQEKEGTHQIRVKNVTIGGDEPVIMAGPCAIEDRDYLFRIAEGVKKAGAHILRGGVFKARSSVHSFQGMGSSGVKQAEECLGWLKEAGEQFEMPVITEVRGEAQTDLIAEYADILQIGSRNMYDQDLLTTVAQKGKPVLLKRHFGAGIEEFLSFAEYIAAENNRDIILCERGIVPVGKGKSYTRYTFDLAAIPAMQKETYLPVIADPSHATGRADLIYNMSCAAIAAGADALMIEVHCDPEKALCDAAQMITPEKLKGIIETCRAVRQVVAAGAEK